MVNVLPMLRFASLSLEMLEETVFLLLELLDIGL